MNSLKNNVRTLTAELTKSIEAKNALLEENREMAERMEEVLRGNSQEESREVSMELMEARLELKTKEELIA